MFWHPPYHKFLYVHKRELTTCCSTPVLSFT
nr:MAG TPA: hypothetical protein [Bacteriophage sp.]